MKGLGYSNNKVGSIPLELLGCTEMQNTIPTVVNAVPAKTALPVNTTTNTGATDAITPEELFKIYLSIDKQFLKPANGQLDAQAQKVDAAFQTIIDTDFPELGLGYSWSEFKDDWNHAKDKFNDKVVDPIREKTKEVVETVKEGAEKAIEFIHDVVAFPARALITALLEIFRGKTAAMFAYALIPADSPVLKANPKVAAKRAKQVKFIDKLTNAASFEKGYILKHIQNNLQSAYKLTPDQFISKLSKGESLNGLGALGFDPVTIAAVVTACLPLLPYIPDLLKIFSPEKDSPDKNDFEMPVKEGETGADTGGNENIISRTIEKASEFVKENPLVAFATAGAVGTGLYFLLQPEKKRKKRR